MPECGGEDVWEIQVGGSFGKAREMNVFTLWSEVLKFGKDQGGTNFSDSLGSSTNFSFRSQDMHNARKLPLAQVCAARTLLPPSPSSIPL